VPDLEQALTFLDDKRLPATPNAVEQENRRRPKMQKAMDRVRMRAALVGRLALDPHRDRQGDGRSATINCLHDQRGTPGHSGLPYYNVLFCFFRFPVPRRIGRAAAVRPRA
jgi:hypothetical protein